jgi:hypothetical protein
MARQQRQTAKALISTTKTATTSTTRLSKNA